MKIIENFNLKEYNSYRLEARCRRAFFPASKEEIKSIYSTYLDEDTEPIVLGGGYNTILSKPYYDRDFILIGGDFACISLLEDHVIRCDAGVSTEQLSEFAFEHSLSGAEIFYDIPSSIGGAVVMNAGASGEEIKDILIKVSYLDLEDRQFKEIATEDIDFSYRNSFFQRNTNKIVLTAWLKLWPGQKTMIRDKMDTVKAARWKKQPRTYPNAGSVFKRPPGYYVGALVQELNLKGYTVGGAQVSEKHAGFIINTGNATGTDIIAIIKHVQRQVKAAYGVDLEVEQRII